MEYSETFSQRMSLKLRLRMSEREGQEVPSQPREQPIMQRLGKHFYFILNLRLVLIKDDVSV